MGQMNRIAPLFVLIAIFIVLQPILMALDCWQTPAKVAKQFIRNYYYLDPDIQQLLCTKEGDAGRWVDAYLNGKAQEAAQRGFSTNYLRRMFTHIRLETEHQDATSAAIRIEGTTRTAINPAFMVIGKIFRIGRDYPVDLTVRLVKENGQWRVCQKAFGMGH